MQPAFKTAAANTAKGALIGIANTIPGVSGGTIAVVTGIYDRIIGAIGGFFREHGGWKANTLFLLPVLAGAAIGILVFAFVIDFLTVNYPQQTGFLFLGLIAGSVPCLVRTAARQAHKPLFLVPFAVCLAVVLVMSIVAEPELGSPRSEIDVTLGLLLVASGFASAAAMIVPGVSGSFVLVLMGTYSTVIRAVKEVNVVVIALVGIGAILGLLLVAKGIDYLLQHHHGATYYGVIGLVIGSLVGIWPGFSFDIGGLASIAAAAVGVGLALLLGSRNRPNESEPSSRSTPGGSAPK